MLRPKHTTYSVIPRIRVVYQRRPLPRCVKETVWAMTRGRCWYCGVPLNPFCNFVVEHVIPLCRGGDDSVDNLVPACDLCNQFKGTRLVEEWRHTQECKANVLDHWDGTGLFWFELEDDGDKVDRYDLYTRQYSRVERRQFALQAHDCDNR